MGKEVKRPYKEGVGVKPTTSKPTPGIMETRSFEDGTSLYRVSCSCDSPDCDLRMWIEGHDAEGRIDAEMALRIDATVRTPIWKDGYNRFRSAMKLLFTGEAEYQTETLMTVTQALLFADTIKAKVKEMDTKRKKLSKTKSQPKSIQPGKKPR